MGTTKAFNYLIKNFHISTLVKSGVNTDDNLSSMAVGGMSDGVTTLEMCAAYATFGNGGRYYAPKAYTKVTNYTGTKTLLDNSSEKSSKAMSEETATIMNRVMQTVVSQGTAQGCGVSGFTTYMKTGTTSDTKDKWACGGTPYYCAAVWYGYDEQEEMATTSTNPAARVWSAVMNRAHSSLSSKDFDYSKNVVAKSYCTKTGKLAGSSCASATGYFDKNHLPDTCNGNHSISMGTTTVTTTRKSATTAATTASEDSEDGTSSTTAAASTTAAPTTAAPSEDPYTPPAGGLDPIVAVVSPADAVRLRP